MAKCKFQFKEPTLICTNLFYKTGQLCEVSSNLITYTEVWLMGNIFAKIDSMYEHNKKIMLYHGGNELCLQVNK